MEKYKFNEIEEAAIINSVVPFAFYQFINQRVVTVLLTDGFMELFGYDDREKAYYDMDNNMYVDTHPDDIARIQDAAVRFATNDEEYNVIYRSKRGDGYRIIHAFGKHVYPEGVKLALVWYVDEGEYMGDELLRTDALTHDLSISLNAESLHRQSNYDFLTGIPNMTYFLELAKTARDACHAKNQHCSLCFANLNGMKFYNTRHGFSEGNILLREFANILIDHFGADYCCRIGQDNFAFVAQTNVLEESINSIFEKMLGINDGKSISVRVGIYPDTMGVVETSRALDRARYACNTLRNSSESVFVYFNDEMLAYETNRQYVLNNLDRALEEKWIQAYYQPIVRAANGRVCDEEALARWIDPEKGMLSPAEFIPILEESKLIYKVDLYMVDRILERMRLQKQSGLYMSRISVNLSRTDFDACDIVDEVCKRVDASGFGRDMLTIEITESVVGSDFDFIKSQVERFQSLGFQVWMDDFGSGYSSLDTLQSIHFDLIKLDMRFMKQFDNSDKSKVIITEIIKMALGLGIETLMEGVETPEQVQFLREVGCTKLQGYYYTKPIPYEEILKRNEEGRQIGFENPEESAYYASIGSVNLYDLSVAVSDDENLNQYFNTLPMAVVEAKEDHLIVLRCNQSYRDFLQLSFGDVDLAEKVPYDAFGEGLGSAFARGIKHCSLTGDRVYIDEKITADSTIHAFIRKISTNPVSGYTACAVVVLGVIKDTGQAVTYADIAHSLSADYLNLYYVNIETEDFVEYHPDPTHENLSVERHGTNFFAASRQDAMEVVYRDDVERLSEAFTKENVLKSIEENGTFTLTYRLLMDDKPVYVNMKAVRMGNDPSHIIIGVNNVDAQMRQQEALERLQEEKLTYDRIVALSMDLIAVYSVDPETDNFIEYGATRDYDGLGFAKYGKDFFKTSLEESSRTICKDDLPLFKHMFNKEIILREIEDIGMFVLNYRLMINDEPTYVSLKATMVDEEGKPQLIVGISNIDLQMRRALEFDNFKKEQ